MVFDFEKHIVHHMEDSYQWHLPFLPPIHLPEPITLHTLMIFIGAALMLFLFCILYQKKARVPSGMTNMLESIVIFVRDDIAIESMGEEDGKRFTPLLLTFFFFILILNLMGLIPVFATATSNIYTTAPLALITMFFMIFGAILKNGFKGFVKCFVPSGVPVPVLFLVVPLEILGLFIRPFALMVRLFANMLGGHITISVLIGLSVLFLGVMTLPILFLVVFIYLMEVLIAFIQAYVFTLLSAMFIGMNYHPDH